MARRFTSRIGEHIYDNNTGTIRKTLTRKEKDRKCNARIVLPAGGVLKRLSAPEYCLVILCFAFCLAGALMLPLDSCPDEAGRKMISDWIASMGTLPTGNEPEVIMEQWGFSYAYRPYLASILSGLFMKLASFLTRSDQILLAASRMTSVLSLTGCCVFCLLLGRRLFRKRWSAILFAAIVCFLPQVMFLGMYQNNDIFSLFAVSMILYFWIRGYDTGWSAGSCAGLAVGLSAGLLSYYSAYGWLLMSVLLCLPAVLTDPAIRDKKGLILRRILLIAGICLLLAGWFFIRNAVLRDGDILGITSEHKLRQDPAYLARLEAAGKPLYEYVNYRRDGMSVWQFLQFREFEWLRMTTQSFVGVFGYMTIYLPGYQYGWYYAVFAAGMILFCATQLHRKRSKRNDLLFLMMVFSSGLCFFLHFWSSYARDYQPQGRYVITFVLQLSFMLADATDRTDIHAGQTKDGKPRELHPGAVLTGVWILLFVRVFFETMMKMLS